jgi:hypothetical protein
MRGSCAPQGGYVAVERMWEVDEANVVKMRLGAFGKKIVTVNGAEVYNAFRFKRKGREIPFLLPDGRQAVIAVKPQFVGHPAIDLWVLGQRIIETDKKKPLKCPSCGAAAKSYDKFCAACGKEMPTAEDHVNLRQVNAATSAIKWLAVIFAVSGALLFFVTKNADDEALGKIRGMDPASVFPTQIEGRSMTVGELQKQLEWEPWGVLIVNLILAAVMVALALWSRRAALPAALVATATYAVVIVGNAIADPRTLTQGLIIKIIIIAFLVKGIRATLALRSGHG